MSLEKPPLHPSSAASVYGITSTKRREFSIAPRQSVANGLLSPAKAATQRVSSTLQFESLSKGTHVWCLDETDAWVRGVVRSVDSKDKILVYVEEQGSEIAYPINNLELSGGDKGEMAAVDDLTKIPVLHEPAILSALQERFESNIIYTTTGPILIAINPFKRLESLYGEDVVMKYYRYPGSTNSNGRNPPHPYALANAAYHSMVDNNGCNQSILVSGESGAGKTETTKIVMNFLSIASQMKVKSKSSDTGSPNNPSSHSVSARVLQANPLLESLGNAKTVRNDNSSRFGKLIRLCFDPKSGRLLGANFATYLLETPRCCEQTSKERNYHIFYELLASAGSEERKRWGIESFGSDLSTLLSNFRYTGGSGNQDVRRADTDDKEQYKITRQAMEILGFTAEEQRAIGDTVLAILHLGNITFCSGPKGEDSSAIDYNGCGHHVDYFCKLLGINDKEELERSLCTKVMHVHGGGDVIKNFSIAEANEGRDALAMSLYERLFGWVVWRVNESIAGDASEFIIQRAATRRRHSSVSIASTNSFNGKGRSSPSQSSADKKVKTPPSLSHDYETAILDIFGFEVFEKNSFEQLCINYANEQLQVQFNEFVFELEQAEYTAEGIDWTYVEFPDNSQCVEMIEGRPIGLLALLDEVCLMQGTSDIDKSLANKFNEHLTKFDSFYVTSKQKVDGGFSIRHFAGDVQYLCKGFSKKNKNQLHDALVQMMRGSNHWLGSTLLPSLDDTSGAALDMELYFTENGVRGPDASSSSAVTPSNNSDNKMQTPAKSITKTSSGSSESGGITKRRSQLQQVTVGSHFKMQLAQAMTLIRASKPHFVRCVKPNDKNTPKVMNRVRVASQLRYSGVLEVVKVTQAGYSARFDFNQFIERYEILFGGRPGSNEIKKTAGSLQQAMKVICEKKLHLDEFKDYQIGKSKIFLRQSACANLDTRKVGILEKSVVKIQKAYRVYAKDKARREAKRRAEQKKREEQEAREQAERRKKEEQEARERTEKQRKEEEERKRREDEERRRAEEIERRRLAEIAEKEKRKGDAAKVIHLYLRPWVHQIRERKKKQLMEEEKLKKEQEQKMEAEELERKHRNPSYQRQKSLMFNFIPLAIILISTYQPPEPQLVAAVAFVITAFFTGVYLLIELYKSIPPLITFRQKERSAKEIARLRRKTMMHRQSLARQSAIMRAMPELEEEMDGELNESLGSVREEDGEEDSIPYEKEKRNSIGTSASNDAANRQDSSNGGYAVNKQALQSYASHHFE